MVYLTEERLGYGFGLLGGVLLLLGALVALTMGAVSLVSGSLHAALNAWSETVVLAVVGGLAIFFAFLGHQSWRDRPTSAGLLLVVVAFLGALALGFGGNVVALVGVLFVGLGGLLYLIEPMRRAAHVVVTA